MYGVIHFVVKDMIVSQFGQEALDKILMAAGLEESQHFKMFYPYEDCVLSSLLDATSKCLNLPMDNVLEVFGDYFIMFTLRHGYDDMLRTLGCDMTSFIQNLDSLHSLLALSYDKMVAPSFRCSTEDDGSLILHYHSSRTGYYPLVKGLLCAAAREIFNQKIDIQTLNCTSEQVEKGKDQVHVTFRVTIVDQSGQRLQSRAELHHSISPDDRDSSDELSDYSLAPVALNKEQFASAFPYHLIFDKKLRLRQYGRNVAKLSPIPLREGMKISSAFHILYPRVAFNVENIRRFINAIFIMAVGPEGGHCDENAFSMKGQMMWLAETNLMIFIGSPRLMSLKEMKRLNMYMADIPLYDVTREMVLLYQQRNAEIDITKKLDETTAELKRTSRELALEKQRTERLLYQMLPERVANQLKNGEQVEAEKFDQVTVLFSDIVNFTGIAAASTPLEVVNMLNDLYHRFDLKTNEHSVYKVETIGDAYMVVSGVPDITDKHAQLVANFALDMVNQAAYVNSPDTGKPLQIRVGTHSGAVVAGVVGVKMPRYCLFGDTVNTASRMESHAVPSRIHVSSSTFQLLKDHGYLCRERGEVNIKGKGLMRTYFLIGSESKMAPEPEDEHRSLPICGSGSAGHDNYEQGTSCSAPRNGFIQDPTHNKDPMTDSQNTNVENSSNKTNSCTRHQDAGSSAKISSDRPSVGKRRSKVGPSDVKLYKDSKNIGFCVAGDTHHDLITNNNKEICCGIRVESSRTAETQRTRINSQKSRTGQPVTLSTDIDSGVSFAEHLTLSENHRHFNDVSWSDTGSPVRFGGSPCYSSSVRDRPVGESEHVNMQSKTCNVL